MQEYFEKIKAVLSAVPPSADRKTIEITENNVSALLDQLEKAIVPTSDLTFYKTLAKQYLDLVESFPIRCLRFRQKAVDAYHVAMSLSKDATDDLYNELEQVYRTFFFVNPKHPALFMQNWEVEVRAFLADAEKDLMTCLNDRRAELLGDFLICQTELPLRRSEAKAKYYQEAAGLFFRALEREKYFDASRRGRGLMTLEAKKSQLINFMDMNSSNKAFNDIAGELITKEAGNLFQDIKALANQNPSDKFYYVFLALMLKEPNTVFEFKDLASAVSVLCLPDNRESHTLTLEAAQKLLLAIVRISQQESLPDASFFDGCRTQENNEILQHCIDVLTTTLAPTRCGLGRQ